MWRKRRWRASGLSVANGLAVDRDENLLAFGKRGFKRRDVYMANFGPGFGDGTTLVRCRYNHRGLRVPRERALGRQPPTRKSSTRLQSSSKAAVPKLLPVVSQSKCGGCVAGSS